MSDWREEPRFEQIDWSEIRSTRSILTAETVSFVLGSLALLSLFLYDRYVAHVYLVFEWNTTLLDWVFLLALLVILSFGILPAVKHWSTTRLYIRYLLSRPLSAFAFVFVVILVLIGLLGPILIQAPRIQFSHAYTPPVGFETEISRHTCAGVVSGEPFSQVCQGTWENPLGTNHRGLPIGYILMTGARVAVYVVVFTAAFVIPIAVATGILAGLRGGIVDDLLMSYVDIQLCLPAIIVYFIGYMYWNVSLLLLLLTFGLLSWGGIARLVRGEVLQRREEGHVMVARGLGASEMYVALHHILPNVSNTVVPAIFHLLALLLLVETGVAFLGFHHIELYSWGSAIAESSNAVFGPGLLEPERDYPTIGIWWASAFPAAALALTMFSFKILGDSLRDALDPQSIR